MPHTVFQELTLDERPALDLQAQRHEEGRHDVEICDRQANVVEASYMDIGPSSRRRIDRASATTGVLNTSRCGTSANAHYRPRMSASADNRWAGMGWMRGPRPTAATVRSYDARRAAASAGSVRQAVPAGSTT